MVSPLIDVLALASDDIERSIIKRPEFNARRNVEFLPGLLGQDEARALHDIRADVRNAIDLSAHRKNDFLGLIDLDPRTDDVERIS